MLSNRDVTLAVTTEDRGTWTWAGDKAEPFGSTGDDETLPDPDEVPLLINPAGLICNNSKWGCERASERAVSPTGRPQAGSRVERGAYLAPGGEEPLHQTLLAGVGCEAARGAEG